MGLESNLLTGEIPSEIGNLINLTLLNLGKNELTEIPPEIGNLTNITLLHLNNIQLTSLPNTLCNLPSNSYINVGSNSLCNEYHYDCLDGFNLGDGQDQSNCCEGPNGEENWTQCDD